MSGETASTAGPPNTVTPEAQAAGAPATEPTASASPIRTIAVVAFLAIALAVALGGRESLPIGGGGGDASAELTASLAVTGSDLAQAASDSDDIVRATGGYVPGVGIVITAEINEMASTDISKWTESVIADVDGVYRLPVEEEVIFLVGVNDGIRSSRLVSYRPSDAAGGGAMTAREAPATSTAPTAPAFDASPDRLASVEEDTETQTETDTESGTEDSE